jgi:hypothetical protein
MSRCPTGSVLRPPRLWTARGPGLYLECASLYSGLTKSGKAWTALDSPLISLRESAGISPQGSGTKGPSASQETSQGNPDEEEHSVDK